MRATSVYSVECVCGHQIETKTTALFCGECGRLVIIRWPAEAVDSSERKADEFDFRNPRQECFIAAV